MVLSSIWLLHQSWEPWWKKYCGHVDLTTLETVLDNLMQSSAQHVFEGDSEIVFGSLLFFSLLNSVLIYYWMQYFTYIFPLKLCIYKVLIFLSLLNICTHMLTGVHISMCANTYLCVCAFFSHAYVFIDYWLISFLWSPSSRLNLPSSFSHSLVNCVALQLHSFRFLSFTESTLPGRAKYLAFGFVAFMYRCTRSTKHGGTGNSL